MNNSIYETSTIVFCTKMQKLLSNTIGGSKRLKNKTSYFKIIDRLKLYFRTE